MMTSFRSTWLIGGALFLWVATQPVHAANCALRDPDRSIYEIYPTATSYRTIARSVDEKVKTRVEQQIGLPLSLNDLGKHSIYVILNNKIPIGFVHARTELGKRGGIELVWGLDLDLKIYSFRIQRSREEHTAFIKSAAFREVIVGQNQTAMRVLLTQDTRSVDEAALEYPDGAGGIAYTAVTSGVKMIGITEEAFANVILKSRLLGNVYRFFPDTAKVVMVRSPIDEALGSSLGEIDPSSLRILRAVDEGGHALGVLVFSKWVAHPTQPEVWWGVSPEGVVRHVVALGITDQTIQEQIAVLEGKRLADQEPRIQPVAGDPASLAAEIHSILRANSVIP